MICYTDNFLQGRKYKQHSGQFNIMWRTLWRQTQPNQRHLLHNSHYALRVEVRETKDKQPRSQPNCPLSSQYKQPSANNTARKTKRQHLQLETNCKHPSCKSFQNAVRSCHLKQVSARAGYNAQWKPKRHIPSLEMFEANTAHSSNSAHASHDSWWCLPLPM